MTCTGCVAITLFKPARSLPEIEIDAKAAVRAPERIQFVLSSHPIRRRNEICLAGIELISPTTCALKISHGRRGRSGRLLLRRLPAPSSACRHGRRSAFQRLPAPAARTGEEDAPCSSKLLRDISFCAIRCTCTEREIASGQREAVLCPARRRRSRFAADAVRSV